MPNHSKNVVSRVAVMMASTAVCRVRGVIMGAEAFFLFNVSTSMSSAGGGVLLEQVRASAVVVWGEPSQSPRHRSDFRRSAVTFCRSVCCGPGRPAAGSLSGSGVPR
eukprot:SAG31_NODE_267_length_18790_cov_3.661655_14_plen_107_part_00